jgi:hypothetical protein
VTKQPELRALCRKISCKAANSFQILVCGIACVRSHKLFSIRNMTRHEFLVKKFERAPPHAVQFNRLRRFGRLHEFL